MSPVSFSDSVESGTSHSSSGSSEKDDSGGDLLGVWDGVELGHSHGLSEGLVLCNSVNCNYSNHRCNQRKGNWIHGYG